MLVVEAWGLIHGVYFHGLNIIAMFLHGKLPDSIVICIIFNYDGIGLLVHQHL
jgi:hypothetical protein